MASRVSPGHANELPRHADFPDLEVRLTSGAGLGHLRAAVEHFEAALVVLSAGETRLAIGAAFGPHEEVERLAARLEPIASTTGAAIVLIHEPDPSNRKKPQPPVQPPAAAPPGLPPAYVAADLDRGRATFFEKQPDTASLVAAITFTSPGRWLDAPTAAGGCVAVGSAGKFTGWHGDYLNALNRIRALPAAARPRPRVHRLPAGALRQPGAILAAREQPAAPSRKHRSTRRQPITATDRPARRVRTAIAYLHAPSHPDRWIRA